MDETGTAMGPLRADGGGRLTLIMIPAGIAIILTGVGIQMLDARLGLMDALGLSGTAFGLMAKAGGAVALAGLLGLALARRPDATPDADHPLPEPAPRRRRSAGDPAADRPARSRGA